MYRRKLFGPAVLVVVAFAALGVAAQAAGAAVWLSDGTPIPAGVVEPVATSGKITIEVRAPTGAPITAIKCKVRDEDNIQNGPRGGTDEMTQFTPSGCKGKPSPCPAGTTTEVTALGLPWSTVLSPGPPIHDQIFGSSLEVRCSNGVVIGTYEGTLQPEVGASVLIFGAGSGLLTESKSGEIAEVLGSDKLKGPKGDKTITAA